MVSDTRAEGAEKPAKLLLERRVVAPQRPAFERWTRELLRSAQDSGALEGSSVLHVGDEAIVILRFTGQSSLERWQQQREVVALLQAWHGASKSGRVVRTGLETWFTLPGSERPAPAKWKMALVTWAALLPHVLLLGALLPKDLPFPLGPALGTALPVASLTWLVMPRLSALLARWLYPTPVEPQLVHAEEAADG